MYLNYSAPLQGWDNYNEGNVGGKIQLHGTIQRVVTIFNGTTNGINFEFALFVIGHETAEEKILLDVPSEIDPTLGILVKVTGTIRQFQTEFGLRIYLEVTKIELS